MEKLFILGPKRLAPAILDSLQQIGVVQIDPLHADEIHSYLPYRLSREEESLLRRWDEVAISSDHAMRLLELAPDPSEKPFSGNLEEAEAAASIIERRAAALIDTRGRLMDERERIERYRPVVDRLAEAVQDLDQSPWLAVLPFLVERAEDISALQKALATTLDDRFLLAATRVNDTLAAVIVVRKGDIEEAKGILSHQGLGELPRPEDYARMTLKAMAVQLAERSLNVPEGLAASADEIRRHRTASGDRLRRLWNRAKDETGRLLARKEIASGRYGFALFGWVPAHRRGRVAEAMIRFDTRIHYLFEPVQIADEAERVPVLLENPEWIQPFEPLISFLNTPRYDSWDPTWVVAAFFPLWFGMIVGDIGYAGVFAGLWWLLSRYVKRDRTLTVDFFKLRLTPNQVARVAHALKPMILWTVLWGLLYGECFGDLLQRLGVFGTPQHSGRIPLLIPRTDTVATANGLILFSIGFGAYQVLYGFYRKALRTCRHGEKAHCWEACGYIGGVFALILFATAFMTQDYPSWLVGAMIAGGALFLLGMFRAGAPLMLAELPTQGGHIMSYIRIYAVGLASAILANLATDLGFLLRHLLGTAGFFIGMIAGLVMALLLHAFLIVLLTVSHLLQPIRLIWVEFFTKFDFYTVTGRPYRPFQSISNDLRREVSGGHDTGL